MEVQGRASGNKELLRERERAGKHLWEEAAGAPFNHSRVSQPGLLSVHQPSYVPREPARGSHTAIFKTDKNRACRTVGSVCTNLGFAQARPNEPWPITQQLLVLSYPGLPLSQGWGPEEWACRASSHLNGNAHPHPPPPPTKLCPKPLDPLMRVSRGDTHLP